MRQVLYVEWFFDNVRIFVVYKVEYNQTVLRNSFGTRWKFIITIMYIIY